MVRKILTIILCGLCLSGCEKVRTEKDVIVVEGWIEEGRRPMVFLHKAVRMTEKEVGMEEMMRERMVYAARVYVSDGTDSVQLIARIDTTYLPPYYYHNVLMKGATCKTYRLTVDYQGQRLSAVTTVPAVVPIDSIIITGAEDVEVCFKDNEATTDYYALFYSLGKKRQYSLASLGVMDDRASQGQTVRWHVNRSNTLLDLTKEYNFAVGDTVSVKLAHIDAQSYAVLSSFVSSAESNTWIFMPKAQIKSNINGGLGYWCGYGSDVRQIVVQERDTTIVYSDVSMSGKRKSL
ncbi:MAG: DUF4249 domain-containing protein [Paludibacteraceae bacterium]|nr:DUF4249 domain-containing protein [Paludibacteraceae bacterium]